MRIKKTGGFTAVMVIFVLLVFAFLGLTITSLIGTGSQTFTDGFRLNQSFHAADAGLSCIAEQLENDTDWSDNTTETKTFGAGSFTITFTAQTPTTATVRSAGTVGGVTSTLQRSFAKGSGRPKAFESAMCAEGLIDVQDTASGNVWGPASAGTSVDSGSGVVFHDAIETPNSDADVPEPNWTYWYNNAGYRYSSGQIFTSGTYNGIYYVNGTCTIGSNVTVKGTLICRQDISIVSRTSITVIADSNNPAVVAGRDVSFNNATGLSINGWIMAMRDFNVLGSSTLTVNGGINGGSDIILSGSSISSITYDAARAPSTAGFTGGTFTASNWQEVF